MSKLKINILAVTACLLWATAFAGVKIALPYTTPFFLAGIRFVLAGALLVPLEGKGYLRSVKRYVKIILPVSLLQTVLMYGLFFTAMNLLPGAIAALIVGSSPLITATVTHIILKNDRFTREKLLSIAVGTVGIVFVVAGRQTLEGIGSANIIGALLLILSMIFSGIGNIVVSKRKKELSPVILNSSQLIIGGFFLIVISLFVDGIPELHPDAVFIAALAWLSFLSAAAFSIWFTLLSLPDVKVSELNMWKFLVPVFGAVFSWILIPAESPNVISVVGMIIISGSILFYFKK